MKPLPPCWRKALSNFYLLSIMNYDLQGLRVLNTRPAASSQSLMQAIEQANGHSIALPVLAIEPTPLGWFHHLPSLETVNQAIFISANAAYYFFSHLKQQRIAWPDTIQVTAVGQATAKALHAESIRVDFIPTIADSEHLLALPSLKHPANQTILLVKGEGGRTLIAEMLINRQATLIPIEVYRRTAAVDLKALLCSLWQKTPVDIILLTSQQAIEHLFLVADQQEKNRLCQIPCLVYSERLATVARSFGVKTILVCRPERVMDALHQFKQGLLHGQ